MVGGRWVDGSRGRWSVVGGRWSVVGGRWSVGSGRWAVGGRRWAWLKSGGVPPAGCARSKGRLLYATKWADGGAMKKWLRRIRGALLMGLTWALIWMPRGLLIGFV